MRAAIGVLGAMVLGALGACESSRSISVDEYAAACHEVACTRAMACKTIANRADCDLPNIAECELDARYIDAVHDHRIVWDGEAAAACLDASLDAGWDRTSEEYRGRRCDFSRGLVLPPHRMREQDLQLREHPHPRRLPLDPAASAIGSAPTRDRSAGDA